MNLNTNELMISLAAGILAGIVLGLISKHWPEAGIGIV